MMEKEFTKWYDKLEFLRHLYGLTQEEIALKIGVSHTTYGRWERGQHRPIPVYQEKIADVLKTPRKDIFELGE